MTRLVVTGSRDWTDRAVVEEALRRLPVGRLAHGGARGLDTIAARIAKEMSRCASWRGRDTRTWTRRWAT